MRNTIQKLVGVITIILVLLSFGNVNAQTISQPGGPYDADGSTLILLTFEGDTPYANLASGTVGDATTTGTPTIVGDRPLWEYGPSVSFDPGDYLQIADDDALDLTGDWTIEAWIKLDQAATSDPGNQDILWKPNRTDNQSGWWHGNYFVEVRDVGNDFDVSSGSSDEGGNLKNIDSCGSGCPGGVLNSGNWYHITFIRDASENTHYQIVHDENMDHKWTLSQTFDYTPKLNNNPLFLGTNGNGRFMDGLINQLRLSNTARTFAPIVDNVSNLTNPQSASSSYTVTAEVEAFQRLNGAGEDEEINTVTLNYNTGSDWQTVSMSNTSGNTYEGAIPQQTAGTVVEYYVSATNNAGQKSVYPFDAEETNPVLFSFAVDAPKEKVLFFDFEEGTGDPEDKSGFGNEVTTVGTPVYNGSTQKKGDYSLIFDGSDDLVRSYGPLADEEFTIDFWLKAGDFSQDWEYIVNKPAIEPQLWGENTFEIYANPASKLTAGVWNSSGGSTRIELVNTALTQGNWYRVVMIVKEAPELTETYGIYFRLHDNNNTLLEADTAGFNNRPTESRYPVRIGKNGGDTETPPYFDGEVDNFSYYNYAREVVDLDKNMTGGENWRMLSSPVEDATYDDLLGDFWTQGVSNSDSPDNGSSNILVYDASVPGFVSISDQTNKITPGKGFIFYAYSDDDYNSTNEGFPKTLNLAGYENEAPVDVQTEASEFNLLGNPYSKYIDYSELSLGGSDGLNDNWNSTIYIYDPNKSGGADYISYNGSTGDITDGLISPYQGFFVEAAAGATNFKLPFSAKTDSEGSFYGKEASSQESIIKLSITKDDATANNYLTFMENGLMGKDSKDAYDLPSMSNTFMSFYSVVNGSKFEINNLPKAFEEELSIPLDFDQYKDGKQVFGSYELTWPEMNNIPADWEITIEDKKTQEVINITELSSYNFKVEKSEVSNKTPVSVNTSLNEQKVKATNARFVLTISALQSTGVENEKEEPYGIQLYQNYPNPFNPTTNIGYEISSTQEISLTVHNVMGQKVATLVQGTQRAGQHQATWNAENMASGVYYYRLKAGNYVQTQKMTLIK